MKTLRLDSVGGASGDMILAALIDLGADPGRLTELLTTLHVDPFEIRTEKVHDHDIYGTQVHVHVGHAHEHGHDHDHHDHTHRGLHDIRHLIEGSELPDGAKHLSILVFERLARAEAHVHNTTPDKIHFHEVGAMDSIVDIVGACTALHLLGIERVVAGPLPLGCGTTTCAHGVLPVPVPATVELLKGYPVVQTDEAFELVTPTGAALVATWSAGDTLPGNASSNGATRITRVAFGIGHRKLTARPNILRAILQESGDEDAPSPDTCTVLECNLDDTIPELVGSLCLQLIEHGALDAFTTPVQMKKQRPGTLLTVLCEPAAKAALLDLIFTESTTLGIREHDVRRTVLERRHADVETPYGTVRVKIGTWKGRDVTRAPEHEDCVTHAREHGVAVRTVYESALHLAHG